MKTCLKQPKYSPVLPTGCFPIPHIDFKEKRTAFIQRSFLTKAEVIPMLSAVWSECNKVTTMKLFNVALNKPLRLDNFEVLQAQIQTKVFIVASKLFFCQR